MFEIDLQALLAQSSERANYEPVSPYPTVEQDLAIIVAADVEAERALSIIRSFGLVRSASVFDVYTGPPVPTGRKSLAFSVSFGSDRQTLKDEDVAGERERIVKRLAQELGAELRA